ncbi:MAG TPA: DUF4286 family protein [Phycisphaerae bacterium]|nr:DUF4286 family protein [Phycisphaerae bacterium]
MAPRILYEVTTILRDEGVAQRWVRWILDEHIADVVRAGAASGRLLHIDDAPHTYVVQYEFASRDSLNTYLSSHAPRLRAEGALRFDASEAAYHRRTATIIER